MLNNEDADRRLSSHLAKWAARPRRSVNITTLAITAVMMTWLVAFASNTPASASVLNDAALFLFALYTCQHALFLSMLRRIRDRGVPEAVMALEAYRDPRRISNLDVAVMWAGLAAISPAFGTFTSTA